MKLLLLSYLKLHEYVIRKKQMCDETFIIIIFKITRVSKYKKQHKCGN